MRARLGARLREVIGDIAQEPLPEEMELLLQKLRRAEPERPPGSDNASRALES